MWLMVGIAVVMIAIIGFTGHSQPAPRVAFSPTAQPPELSPEHLRDYQDRLRALDERARSQAQEPAPPPMIGSSRSGEPAASRQPDPLEAERQRREYDSLFAGNVVLSRRPTGQQPLGERDATRGSAAATREVTSASPPNLDDVADAVVRATTRVVPAPAQTPVPTPTALPQPTIATASAGTTPFAKRTPASTEPISSSGPTQRLLEGTVIDTVLTNRLDGGSASPVNCLVTNPMYSHDRQHVVIPAGSRVLGETKPVQALGESRLAVAFHRLIFPDGRTVALDQFTGLNQIGDAALRDQVNHHYLSTFGAAGAVGLITGLGQYLGTLGFGGGSGDRTVVIAGGFGNATSEATAQVMNRFLNRLPTVTIREGHRVKVYLTSDLELPAYDEPASSTTVAKVP
jgi:type IV secretion system protein VirB10